MIVIIVTEMR